MATGIKINCRKVYETGLEYQNDADVIKEKKEKLQEISSSIDEAWTGMDSHNFQVSFNEHIKLLDNLISFLEENQEVLKNSALNHNIVDNNFKSKMKRSELDEQP